MNAEILNRMVTEVGANARQISAVEKLLAEGNTIPFIARYRKEAHGNLDEVAIGKIKDRLEYYTELEARKETVLKSIDEQGKLTDELRAAIAGCFVKSRLEDIYQPYKPKRRTRAQVAKEKGYEPLADAIWEGRSLEWNGGEPTDEDLQFARDIIAERIADNADVRGFVRGEFARRSRVKSEVASPAPKEPTKYEQYYDFEEPIATIPSHRYLAIRRGQKEGVLWVKLVLDEDPVVERIVEIVSTARGARRNETCDEQLELAARDAYRRLLAPSCEIDVTVDKKAEADRAAVEVFAENLRHLLLASPLGEKAVLAIDPGIRTGCKVAMLDSTGKYLGKTVIFPQQNPLEAAKAVAMIVAKYHVEAVAVGNGTAGRETESFVRDTLKKLHAQHPEIPTPIVVSVSEAGASVYSASEIARKEFPDLDLTVRGAEGDWRRPVPARCFSADAWRKARRSRSLLRERRRRRAQHRVCAALGARLRNHADACKEHRRMAQRKRKVLVSQRPQESEGAWRQGVRAVRGLPQDPWRGESARLVGGASRALRACRQDGRGRRAFGERTRRQFCRGEEDRRPSLHHERRWRADLEGHRGGTREAGARSSRDIRAAEVPR